MTSTMSTRRTPNLLKMMITSPSAAEGRRRRTSQHWRWCIAAVGWIAALDELQKLKDMGVINLSPSTLTMLMRAWLIWPWFTIGALEMRSGSAGWQERTSRWVGAGHATENACETCVMYMHATHASGLFADFPPVSHSVIVRVAHLSTMIALLTLEHCGDVCEVRNVLQLQWCPRRMFFWWISWICLLK